MQQQHIPSTQAPRAPYRAVGPRIWSQNGDVLIAECKSPALCAAANAAVARELAEGGNAVQVIRRMVESAIASPGSVPDGNAFIDALNLLRRVDGIPSEQVAA
jgi:hypothetical protein